MSSIEKQLEAKGVREALMHVP